MEEQKQRKRIELEYDKVMSDTMMAYRECWKSGFYYKVFTCACGGKFSFVRLQNHYDTKKHKDYIRRRDQKIN